MSKRNHSPPAGSDLRSIRPLLTRSAFSQDTATGGERSALSTAHPSFRGVLLETDVLSGDEEQPVVDGWVILPCVGRGAYGDLGLLKGVTLVARLAVPPSLSQIRLCVGEDLLEEKGYVRQAIMLSADKDLMLIHVLFQHDELGCYLIYDAADASLSIAPHPRVSNPDVFLRYTARPLIFRRDDGTYALVLPAAIEFSLRDCLCVWPPLPQPSLASSSNILPWCLKKVPVYPEATPNPSAKTFSVHKMFSFQGKAFWADLTRGILYCELADLLSDKICFVPFHFISLPSHGICPEVGVLPQMLLTIGCIGDSIKFALISTPTFFLTPTKYVAMWTLTSNLQEWQEDGRLLLADLFKQQEFVKAGLRASPPIVTTPVLSSHPQDEEIVMTPVLSSHPQDEDGVLLCLLMGVHLVDKTNSNCARFNEHHMLCIDMRSNRFHSSAPLPSDDFFFVPSIIASDIFDHCATKHLLRFCPAQDVAITTALEEESPSNVVSA